ncbi:H-type small acid-soluble spore protein [Lottiidibacillus patelloidae]|uniref:Small, acid-soluble spore protein H n=1 Tax=Lottiidibacillus patelloidae TaxID=2670334 RepID=A0A263BUJ7_9BACI|nr:H-type small acid-soluble spore protein [Lottiidibacillus patelloidae]OZM57421.1 H-type small acid-soluble spore protein [Lottiidibacillus patelloidae]
MNINRAKQIIDSPNEIIVLHNNEAVWLQSVDENAQIARVYTRDNPDDEKQVNVKDLIEQ